MKDQPDIFWCDGTATATTHKGTESYTVLKPKYFYTAEESQKMQTAIMQAAEKWLADLDADADDYHKILYVYEKIVDEVSMMRARRIIRTSTAYLSIRNLYVLDIRKQRSICWNGLACSVLM